MFKSASKSWAWKRRRFSTLAMWSQEQNDNLGPRKSLEKSEKIWNWLWLMQCCGFASRWIRILLVTLIRIRILASIYSLKTLKKCSKIVSYSIHFGLSSANWCGSGSRSLRRIRILLFNLMRIRILASIYGPKTLRKCSNTLIFHTLWLVICKLMRAGSILPLQSVSPRSSLPLWFGSRSSLSLW